MDSETPLIYIYTSHHESIWIHHDSYIWQKEKYFDFVKLLFIFAMYSIVNT